MKFYLIVVSSAVRPITLLAGLPIQTVFSSSIGLTIFEAHPISVKEGIDILFLIVEFKPIKQLFSIDIPPHKTHPDAIKL